MKQPLSNFFIILYGPTGVGKTDFSIDLARNLGNAEIINADLGQLYSPLTIGTAKPDWKNQSVTHHGFDVINEPVRYTVVEYRDLLLSLMRDMWARDIIPIVVGGSGFYLKSVLFPPQPHINAPTIDSSLFPVDNQHDVMALWKCLHAIDPVRADQIHAQDLYRIRRALAVWQTTGKKPSELVPIYDPPANYIFVHLTRDRADLYARINQRANSMLDQGWLEEVVSLLDTPWEPFLIDKKIIGYDDIIAYLRNPVPSSKQELIETIGQKTRNYAKRQETFGRMLARLIAQEHACAASFNLTLSGVDLYIMELSEQVKALMRTKK